jgi:phosphatidylserine/phosphatidylglycerophosphate/cardiolipin synthase-like enzyme
MFAHAKGGLGHRRTPRTGTLLVSAPVVAFIVFLSLMAPAGPGTIPTAAAATWKPTPGVKFNVPRAGAKQYILEQQVIGAINHAPAGSSIKMSMFSFDRWPVSDALANAWRRGVNVQLITNDHELPPAQERLKRGFGSYRTRPTFFYQCSDSCRGQGDVNHSKFILFSQTGAAVKTVMLGSLNMKQNGTDNQFNDLYTVNDALALYNTFNTVFQQMAQDVPANPMRLTKTFGSSYKLQVMPFPKDGLATTATMWTPSRDPIMQLLAPVSCRGASTPDGRTRIRIDMHAWDGDRGAVIARRVKYLYDHGCDVKIAVGFMSKAMRRIIFASSGRGRVPARSTGFDTNSDGVIDLYSHKKLTLIYGHYGTETGKKIVMTGSSNFQNGGQYGDEILFQIYNRSIYNQYYDNWNWLFANHTHGMA